ncbi:MAG: cation-transporting P-type ATPase [Gemmatales bacterium]|nr:cation-transporting P-type ATPase [Gemmatales bacterium]MDW8176561.1 cation-transporting P-type ATPase [Gemmatales bacterium]
MVPHIRRVWHSISVQETLKSLHVSLSEGLSEAEAQERLESFGPNALVPLRRETVGHVLVEAISEPMILLLLTVGVLYAFWGELWETAVVFAIIGILVGVEVYNEWRTEKALESLRELAQPWAAVRRDGQIREVPVIQLVPGDEVLLLAGRRVPADLRLVETVALAVDESILTGESLPVEKDADLVLSETTPLAERRNLAYAGTLVVRGRGVGIVVATGRETEWGRVAHQTAALLPEKTPLQRTMRELARWTVLAALALTALAAGLAYARTLASARDAILSGLALAFFTIPEELPIIITMVLALGGWRLARQRAIVRRLQAVETLGAVSLIAADKTGTLTENRMSVAAVHPSTRERRCLELAVFCSDTLALPAGSAGTGTTAGFSWLGDPTEAALLERARQAGILADDLQRLWLPRREFPFDPERRRMSAVWQHEARILVAVKGAPESVLACCARELADASAMDAAAEPPPNPKAGALGPASPAELVLTEDRRQYWLQLADRLAESGHRVLAFAERWHQQIPTSAAQAEADLTFVGLVALADPPRREVPAALAECRAAGIRVIMVTGDHAGTARRIAQEVGFAPETPLLTGQDLDRLDDAALQAQLNQPIVLARATPQHKLRLVQSAKRAGERVAVTGDGVNDAPALRAADVGIAMGQRGSDVAREAADLILADDNFATLVHAVREGRLLFANLSKSVRYYLACKLGLLASCLAGVLTGVGIPFHPLQVIVLELFVDLGASVALVAEPPEGDLMRRRPRDPHRPFLHGRVLADLFAAAATLFLAVTLSYWLLPGPASASKTASTSSDLLAASSFVAWFAGHVSLAWAMRTDRINLWRHGWFRNPMLLLWTLLTVGFLGCVATIPCLKGIFLRDALTGQQWGVVLLVALAACSVFRVIRPLWTHREPPLA